VPLFLLENGTKNALSKTRLRNSGQYRSGAVVILNKLKILIAKIPADTLLSLDGCYFISRFNPDDHAATYFIQQLPHSTANAAAAKTSQAFSTGTLGFVVTGD
jgi:hypothetical protein